MKQKIIPYFIFLTVACVNAQSTKIVTKTKWNSQYSGYVTEKKKVFNKSPYKRHGKTEYFLDGNLIASENYNNGKKEGKSITYQPFVKCEGQPWRVEVYKKGVIGNLKTYGCGDDNIYLSSQIKYKDGKEYEISNYYENGNKENILRAHHDTNLCILYYENGNKKTEHYHLGSHVSVNNNYNGDYVSYYENGNMYQKGSYDYSRKQGEWGFYNDNGTIESKGNYLNGKKEGEWISYDVNGNILSKENFVEGKTEAEILEEKERREKERREKERHEKERLENQRLNTKITTFNKISKEVEGLYKVKDFLASNIAGKTLYKFKKNRLYQKYLVLINYINLQLKDTVDTKEKIRLIDFGLRLNNKMKLLRNQNTKSLEKSLKKIDEPLKIIEALSLNH